MKVAFVTPRYGPRVIGGAEAAARQLAEHLVAETAWQAEVYSTCALDPRTWADELAPGDAEIGGVTVHRFAADHGRLAEFPLLDARLRRSPQRASMAEARQWVDANGPVSHGLVDAVAGADADVVAFYPYLYHPTVAAIGRATVPSVLHPAAHDEPALYLPVFGRTFGAADALCYHGTAERRLVERAFPVAARPQIELGLGVGPSAGTGRRGAEVLQLSDRPYIVSVGRVDEQKGSTMLSAYFAEYKLRHPGPLALVLIGPVSAPIAPHRDIVVTGTVSEADKWDIVHDAAVSVSPSALESFSLVVLEAWVDGVPVLVNGRCEPTMEHCRRSGGGLWFTSFLEFDAVLQRLIDDPQLRRSLGGRGRAYVEGHYRWSELIGRYADFLERVVARGTRRSSGPVPIGSSSRSA